MSTVESGSSDEATVREEQAAKVKAMGPHEMIAYRLGHPPDQCCIATPEDFKEALETGKIDVIFSPISQAIAKLDQMFPGLEPLPALGASFSASAETPNAPVDTLDSIFKPTTGFS